VNLYQILGAAIADSMHSAVGALHVFGAGQTIPDRSRVGWHEQFSAASLDERRARRTADAMFRGATVRS
jgi:hypothetical protein